VRIVGPRVRPLRIEVRLSVRDRGAGRLDLAGQVQSGAFGDLLLAMEEIRDMLGSAVFLDVAGRDRNTTRATLGQSLSVSAFPLYVPV